MPGCHGKVSVRAYVNFFARSRELFFSIYVDNTIGVENDLAATILLNSQIHDPV